MKWKIEEDNKLLILGFQRRLSNKDYGVIARSFKRKLSIQLQDLYQSLTNETEEPTAKAIQERVAKLNQMARKAAKEMGFLDDDYYDDVDDYDDDGNHVGSDEADEDENDEDDPMSTSPTKRKSQQDAPTRPANKKLKLTTPRKPASSSAMASTPTSGYGQPTRVQPRQPATTDLNAYQNAFPSQHHLARSQNTTGNVTGPAFGPQFQPPMLPQTQEESVDAQGIADLLKAAEEAEEE